MATEQLPKINKTAFVRNVLKEIGAITANPPEGWRQKVEEALKSQNLSMHQVTIYQIRQTALKEAEPRSLTEETADLNVSPPKEKKAGRPKSATAKVTAKGKSAIPQVHEFPAKLSFADLQSLQELAKRIGGLDGVIHAANLIKSFKI